MDLVTELESNIALWEAIKQGGAIGDGEDTSCPVKEGESTSWLKSWVKKDNDDDDDGGDGKADGDTPSWFARWVDGVTAEDGQAALEDDAGVDSDGSLDDDFASDEEEERRTSDVLLQRKSSTTLQAFARGMASRKRTSSYQSQRRMTSEEDAHIEKVKLSEEAERRKVVKNLLDRAIRTFNVNSKRGVKFVISSGMVVSGDAGGMAEFLVTTKGLNKEKVTNQRCALIVYSLLCVLCMLCIFYSIIRRGIANTLFYFLNYFFNHKHAHTFLTI